MLLLVSVLLFFIAANVVYGQKIPVRKTNVQRALDQYTRYYSRLSAADRNMRGSGYKPFKRWEWFLQSRMLADGTYPVMARWNTFQDVLQRRALNKSTASAANWTSIGPDNIGGRMLGIAFDPNNYDIIWAGAASGGIWKSTDGGANWTAVDDNLPTLAIGCVVTHYSNSNIIYLGTGEGSFNIDAVWGVGVLKSVDGGNTWQSTGLAWELSDYGAVNGMVMDPTNGNILIAATKDGVYRTADAGDTWTRTLFFESGHEDAKAIVIDPVHPGNVFVTIGDPWGDENNGIYKSSDNGVTWVKLTNGLPTTSTDIGRASLTICKSNPSILYAGMSGSFDYNSGGLYGVYKTTDGGNSWVQTCNSPNFYNSQGWYDNVIKVDPNNPDIVYSGGVDLYKSTDGGVNWSTITNGIHVDQHALEFRPDDSSIIYAGNDGGMWRTTNGGNSWQDRNNGLTTMQFYAMGSDANNSSVAFGGAQDNGSNRYTGSTSWEEVLGADGFECNVDYSNSDIVYAEYQNGTHWKSTDGGDNWIPIVRGLGGDGPWVTPVEMDPVNSATLYTISNSNLYYTTDGGNRWSLLFDADKTLSTCIRVAPSDNQTIYVSGSDCIYRTTDGGTNWTEITAGLGDVYLTYIAVHPTQPQTVFVTSARWNDGQHIYKSIDGGDTWENITHDLPNIPCNTIVIDPVHPDFIYVGTDLGTYTSTNGGTSWNEWNTGLPNVVVDELDIQADSRIIFAATHGRGMYQSPLQEPGAGYSISGVVKYDGTERSVANTNLDLSYQGGSDQKVTDANGEYLFENIPGGDVTLTPSKDDDIQDAITGSDALLVLQYLAFLATMNDDQQFAADVTEDGSVSGSDAQAILRYLAFYTDDIGSTGQWRFKPASSSFNLSENATVDFKAYLLGDANLDWGSESSTMAKKATTKMALKIESVRASQNGEIQLPVWIENVTEPVRTLIFSISYDPAKLRYRGVETTSLSEDFMLAANGENAGKVHIAMAGVRGAVQAGTILRLSFDAVPGGKSDEESKIEVTRARINDLRVAEITTGVISFNGVPELPKQYSLSQNYPNPFNPATMIIYQLPAAGHVDVRIYNLAGNEITRLVNEEKEAGVYRIKWDGRNAFGKQVPSGMYIVKLISGNYKITRKILKIQ